jgi:FkbM family methyltransferase
MIKKLIKKLLLSQGYEIRKQSYYKEKDAFDYQKMLMEQYKGIDQVQTIFDVGAYDGQTALRYAFLFPKAQVYAFEPFPESFQQAAELTKQEARIKPYPMAVSSSEGKALLNINEFAPTNSLLASNKIGNDVDHLTQTKRTEEVNTISLDTFCTNQNITFIDILKMDIQGGELDALKGAEKLLKTQKIGLIYTEVEFVSIYKEQPLFSDIELYLRQFGYSLYKIMNLKHNDNGQLLWADAIFINIVHNLFKQ